MPLPHVSDIIRPYIDSTWFTEDSRERGQRVHGAIASWIIGTWSPRLPEKEQPYFDSFMLWAEQFLTDEGPCEVESVITDPRHGFCGTLDYLGPYATDETVIDWKTPITESRAWQLAGSAYFHLANLKRKVKRVGNLQLSPKGRMAKMNWVDNPEKIFPVFLSGLNMWRFFNI